ncbi:MAG TPA: proline racemase family protein, partial [Vicinamibacterales bacterium]
MASIRCIDGHTAGEPLRLIVEGFPTIEGRTILEKREFIREHYDHLRRALMLEPRGHYDMYGALLTEPEHAGSDAGVLFMHNAGFSTMCGHGTIAVVTMAIERGLIVPRVPGAI